VTVKLDISEVERTIADLAAMKERIGAFASRPDAGALSDASSAIERYAADIAAGLEDKRKVLADAEAKVVSAQAKVDQLQVRGTLLIEPVTRTPAPRSVLPH
jgi:hypothetical protein